MIYTVWTCICRLCSYVDSFVRQTLNPFSWQSSFQIVNWERDPIEYILFAVALRSCFTIWYKRSQSNFEHLLQLRAQNEAAPPGNLLQASQQFEWRIRCQKLFGNISIFFWKSVLRFLVLGKSRKKLWIDFSGYSKSDKWCFETESIRVWRCDGNLKKFSDLNFILYIKLYKWNSLFWLLLK